MKKNFVLLLLCLICFYGIGTPAQAAEHYICDGEHTLAQVAEETGVELGLLALANDMPQDCQPEADRLLTLPTQLLLAVTVEQGDTLWGLCQQYNCSLDLAYEYNPGLQPRLMRVGQTVYLPLDEEQACAAPEGEITQEIVAASANTGSFHLSWPAEGVITSYYGEDRGNRYHSGLDLANDSGTLLTAAAAGEVIEAGWKNDSYGWTVMLDHGQGWQTLYAHCSEVLVSQGEQVKAGDVLAVMGETGNATGPHVHLELRYNGVCQDPLDYLPL